MAEKVLTPDVVDLSQGIDTNRCDLGKDFRYTKDTKNVTTGINDGIGPRYGMAPMPNHSHEELGAFSSPNALATMQISELAAATLSGDGFAGETLHDRLKIYSIMPITLGSTVDPSTKSQYYLWVFAYNYAANTPVLCYSMNSTFSSSIYRNTTDFTRGFIQSAATISSDNPVQTLIPASGYVSSYLYLTATAPNYGRFALMTVKGQNYQAQWMIGTKVGSTPDATHSATPNFNFESTGTGGGIAPEVNLGTFSVASRMLVTYNLSTKLERAYFYNSFGSTTCYVPALNCNLSTANMSFGGAASSEEARLDGVGATYANVTGVLVHDTDAYINSAYTIVLSAIGNKPRAMILQDWNTDSVGRMEQHLDLTNFGYGGGSVATIDGYSSGPYLESETYLVAGTAKATAFAAWPTMKILKDVTTLEIVSNLDSEESFSAATGAGIKQVYLGRSGTGVLRSSTIYEFTYAIFDKRTGYESNVGIPVKFSTNPNNPDPAAPTAGYGDYFSLIIQTDAKSGAGAFPNQSVPDGFTNLIINRNFNFGSPVPVNYLEIRFYYREEGAFEWLPALFIDAAKFFFFPNNGYFLRACTGPIVGLPGGQPGGFQDYSNLPKKPYVDTVVFQNRAFWIAKDSLHYSLVNNPLAYPVRNTVSVQTGEFLGAVVRTFPGQSEQSSRLVVFGTTETLIGRFTGNRSLVNVQVGPDPSDIGQFELDGSDFVLEARTSNTAFSSRAAVVADGILYYWGPQGLIRDDGVNLPERVSQDFEPDIFALYDNAHTDQIHAVYASQTKEVIWFYPLADGSTDKTGMLVWDARRNVFFLGEVAGIVDAAFQANIQKYGSIYGNRTFVTMRVNGAATTQRAYFFDWKNRAGDLKPASEMLIKQISTPVAGYRRLTLAAGYSGATFAGVSVGDTLVLDQAQAYGGVTTVTNLMALVTAHTATYVEIKLPTGATLDAQTFSGPNFLPVYFNSVQGFSYDIQSKYWAPFGVRFNGFWKALHFLLKVRLLTSDIQSSLAITYRTPVSGANGSASLTLVDNSDGNCQKYVELAPGDMAFEGQALKIRIAGTHIGNEWVLQYLLAEINDQTFDTLKHLFSQEDY